MPCTQVSYGCVFCRTGREAAVARALEQQYPGLEAVRLTQVKHRSVNGVKSTREQVIFPGYVFFRVPSEDVFTGAVHRIADVLRLLAAPGGDWALAGTDARFAQWVFENKGIVGMSEAHKVGDKVVVHSGPLKALEGQVLKVDRRSRNELVAFQFDDRVWKIWLGYEVVNCL